MKSTKLENDIFVSTLTSFYAFDGLDNNQINPNDGAFDINLDIALLGDDDRNSRVISNTLAQQDQERPGDRSLTDSGRVDVNNFLSEGPGDDFRLGYKGKNILAKGLGADFYQLDLDVAGSKMMKRDVFDDRFTNSGGMDLDRVNLSQTSSFSAGLIEIPRPKVRTIGLGLVDHDSITDISPNDFAHGKDDLKVTNFSITEGKARKGLMDGINNVLGSEIGDYFVANSGVSPDASVLHRFFRQDIGSHFDTTLEAEIQAGIHNLHQYIYEKVADKSPTIKNNIFASGLTNFYSIDGLDNNQINPNYGSAGSHLVSTAPLDYGDGISSPAGANRPNSRVISNTLAQQYQEHPSELGLTNFIWAFGQFLDHDIVLTPENSQAEVHIPVPAGDQHLDPHNTGNVTIPLDDTAVTEGTGPGTDKPAEIANNITAWIDGSNIYGSDQERNHYLREFTGGLLKVSEGNLLPYGTESLENANPSRQNPHDLFAAGDIRANENAVLVAMHTLFVREHNRIAGELARAHPKWSDEQLYERARQINIAQYQSIVYNEYLPAILGVKALPKYSGYDPTVNPNIDRNFSSAAFRIGHTQLSSKILRLDAEGKEVPEGSLTLSEVFFGSTKVVQEGGIDSILRGVASSLSQKVDLKLIDDVRNLLFTFGPHTSGRDLFAINVERGRLNGISDYNTVRHAYGLSKVDSFEDITSDKEIQAKLKSLYGNVHDIDLFVGLLAEDHQPGAAVGETFQTILAKQFMALREGDRFYYERIFNPAEIVELNKTKLSDIILRNTKTTIIQDNAFSLLNKGTSGDDRLHGGLGDDSIYGGRGHDFIKGFQGDDLLSGGRGDDFLFDHQGKNVLKGGLGNDFYQLSIDSAGSKIKDRDGLDYLLITSGEMDVDHFNLSWPSSFDAEVITIAKPKEGYIGVEKLGKDLIIDISRDGIANAKEDLKIGKFFNSEGEAGTGLIEVINNVWGYEIVDYFNEFV